MDNGDMALVPPIAALLLLAAAAAAGPPDPGQRARALRATDVLGREITVPIPGRLTLLAFASFSNGEAVGAISRELRVDHPEIENLSFLDLSGVPRVARGLIRQAIVMRQAGAVKETREAFVRAGKVPPTDLDERAYVIPDFEAEHFATYGVLDTDTRPRMMLIGADGVVRAVFEAHSLEAARSALDRALAPETPAVAAAPAGE
jgi:hypothetical protein